LQFLDTELVQLADGSSSHQAWPIRIFYMGLQSFAKQVSNLLASNVRDLTVYSKDMVNVGRIKDVEFDPSEMRVTNIIVEFNKEAAKHILGKMLVLRRAKGRVPPASIHSIKDALNLTSTWTELKGAFKGL